MISLNLLSPSQKEYLRYEHIYLTIRTVISLVLTFTVIISGMFMAARLMLQDNFAELLTSTTRVNERSRPVDREISNLNGTLRDTQNIQTNFVKWSSVLTTIAKAIPENIQVNYMNLEAKNHVFNLNGLAKRREDFLKLEESLKQLPLLEEVSSPTSNLLLRENVSFQITARLKAEAINQ